MRNADCGLKIACEMKLVDIIADCELQNPRSEIINPRFAVDWRMSGHEGINRYFFDKAKSHA